MGMRNWEREAHELEKFRVLKAILKGRILNMPSKKVQKQFQVTMYLGR